MAIGGVSSVNFAASEKLHASTATVRTQIDISLIQDLKEQQQASADALIGMMQQTSSIMGQNVDVRV